MLGEIISTNVYKFNYVNVLKNNLALQEKNENKDLFLATISKEIAISKTDVIDNKPEPKEENVTNEITIEEPTLEEITISQVEEKQEEVPTSLPTTVIQANNLTENYNTIYNDIKIKNETNFNLSQDILNPNVEFSDKTNIIIFHTHTCESYTQTQEYSYVASRQLSNNRFRTISCKSRKCFIR